MEGTDGCDRSYEARSAVGRRVANTATMHNSFTAAPPAVGTDAARARWLDGRQRRVCHLNGCFDVGQRKSVRLGRRGDGGREGGEWLLVGTKSFLYGTRQPFGKERTMSFCIGQGNVSDKRRRRASYTGRGNVSDQRRQRAYYIGQSNVSDKRRRRAFI